MSGIAATYTFEDIPMNPSTQYRNMSPAAEDNHSSFHAFKASPRAPSNHPGHHSNSGYYHHSEPLHPRRTIPQASSSHNPSTFHHHHHQPMYTAPKFHYHPQQQVHQQNHGTNSQLNSQLPLTQPSSRENRIESSGNSGGVQVAVSQHQEHQLQHSRKLSAFTHHHIDQTTTDSCSSTQPPGNNENKSNSNMQESQISNSTTTSESNSIKSEEISSVVQKPQLLFSATKDPSATSYSASSNPSSPFPHHLPSSASVGSTAMKQTGFPPTPAQQQTNNSTTASPTSPSPTTSTSVQPTGGRIPIVSNLPSANVTSHHHQQLPASPRESSRIEATFGLASPVRQSNSFFETSPVMATANSRTNTAFAREGGGSFKPFVASPTSTSSSPSTSSSGISSLLSSSSSSAFSTPQKFPNPNNTNGFSSQSQFAPPTKPQSFYPNGVPRGSNNYHNTSPYDNRSIVSGVLSNNPNNREKARGSYPPSPLKTKSTATYSIEEARNSGSEEEAAGSPTKPETSEPAAAEKNVNAADRVWAYEVKKQDISLDIEVKSKKETFTNYIPVELYCTYIYKVCVKVSGIKKTNKPYVLVAFLQILNGNTLEEVLKEGARIMEGSANSQIQNSDYFILRVKFTETSYHMNRLQFYMRISIYQVFGEDVSDLANLTPEFVLTHNSYNNGNNLLASTLSPLFFIYSKKNHTKKAQKQARILSQQRQLEQQRKRQQNAQGNSGRSKRRKTTSAQTPEDEEDSGVRTRSGNRFRKSPNSKNEDFEEDYNEEADSSPSPEDD